MSNIPSLTPYELMKILKKKGFYLDRSKGSHHIFIHESGKKRVVVPVHKKEIPKGTFFSILKQAGIDKNEL